MKNKWNMLSCNYGANLRQKNPVSPYNETCSQNNEFIPQNHNVYLNIMT